jgi:hypothetical protein
VGVCVGALSQARVRRCRCAAAPHRGAAATDRAHPPRTRRAFVASRWNTYAARRRDDDEVDRTCKRWVSALPLPLVQQLA